jgi:maleate isomerase
MTRSSCFGIATPQANPVVEAECRRLFPWDLTPCVMRLTSDEQDSLARLRDYLRAFATAPRQFDTLRLSGLGFACTGTSYLVPAADEAALVARLEQHFAAPVVTAASALLAGVAALGGRRIALLCPYPEGLCTALSSWWERQGIEVVAVHRLPTATADTRGIYALTAADARAPLAALRRQAVDVVVVSGTGLPSLSLLAAAMDEPGAPVVSSNLCLVWELLRRSGRAALAGEEPRRIHGWRARSGELPG